MDRNEMPLQLLLARMPFILTPLWFGVELNWYSIGVGGMGLDKKWLVQTIKI
ncbi:MAG: hypothetical protein H7832_02390 [Magnetococcus sp. DMHC-6]